MTDPPTITLDAMKPKLLPLQHAQDVLARTEPLGTHYFSVGDGVRFTISPGWYHGLETKNGDDLVDAQIHLGRASEAREYPLTKDALLEASSLRGIPKGYASRCPADVLEPQLNYWFRHGDYGRIRDYQLLTAAGRAAAVTRASIKPFSNLRLLEHALDGIAATYGNGEILVDYKFVHTLRRTHLRLIIPGYARTMAGTGIADDTWSVGLQIRNSLIGMEQTSIDGYLFRWWCTNGAIDTRATSGVWSRRGAAGGNEAEVYEWARAAVDDVLGGLEPALDAVQSMVDIPIEGQANDVLRDVFTHYRVPLPERARITENMVETSGPLTMYAVMAAVTQAANDVNLDPAHVENLLRLGGDLPHAATSRCDSCLRLLPH